MNPFIAQGLFWFLNRRFVIEEEVSEQLGEGRKTIREPEFKKQVATEDYDAQTSLDESEVRAATANNEYQRGVDSSVFFFSEGRPGRSGVPDAASADADEPG